MTDQQRRLLDMDADFQAFLRERYLTLRTAVMHSAPTARGEVLDTVYTQPAELEVAIREALIRQGDSSSSSPTIRGPVLNPAAQEFLPSTARARAASGQQSVHSRTSSGQQASHSRSASGQGSGHSRTVSEQQGGRSRATSGLQNVQGSAEGGQKTGFNPEAKEWRPPGQ